MRFASSTGPIRSGLRRSSSTLERGPLPLAQRPRAARLPVARHEHSLRFGGYLAAHGHELLARADARGAEGVEPATGDDAVVGERQLAPEVDLDPGDDVVPGVPVRAESALEPLVPRFLEV